MRYYFFVFQSYNMDKKIKGNNKREKHRYKNKKTINVEDIMIKKKLKNNEIIL